MGIVEDNFLMMSQSLEILNCDEHLIFMDTFSNGDINHVVSEAYFFSNLVGEAYSLKYLNGRTTFFNHRPKASSGGNH